MTRAELSAKVGLKDADVKNLFDTIKAEVKAGNEVDLARFGKFVPATRAPRVSRNPQTGATVQVGAKKTVKFKASKTFKDELNA